MVYKVKIDEVLSRAVIGIFQEYIKENTQSLANSLAFFGNILIILFKLGWKINGESDMPTIS